MIADLEGRSCLVEVGVTLGGAQSRMAENALKRVLLRALQGQQSGLS